MSEWTPTPWFLGAPYQCEETGLPVYCIGPVEDFSPEDVIAEVRDENQPGEANAARIVQCVNGFDALVEALTDVTAVLQAFAGHVQDGIADVALAKAKALLPPSTSNPEGK